MNSAHLRKRRDEEKENREIEIHEQQNPGIGCCFALSIAWGWEE
jgi:hypothetical protein